MTLNPLPYVGIIWAGDKRVGTGFIIDTDYRLLVTAYHVIEDNYGKHPGDVSNFSFQLFNQSQRFHIKSLIANKAQDAEDIALLELAELIPANIEQPELITNVSPSSDVWIMGYVSEKQLQRNYKSAQGRLRGLTDWNGVPLYELDIDGVYYGMSGAPVIVGNRGVIGVFTGRMKELNNLVAFVTPIEYLATLDTRIETPRNKYLRDLIARLKGQEQNLLELGTYVDLPVAVIPTPDSMDREFYSSIVELPGNYSKYMLVGHPGSGKTSTLKHLVVKTAQTALLDPQAPLPVWIELHHWTDERDGFVAFLKTQLLQEDTILFDPLIQLSTLEEIIRRRQIILFLDELDELRGATTSRLKDWAQNTNLKVVISCREHLFTGNRRFELPVIFLQPLNTVGIYEFAHKYLHNSQLADEFVSKVIPEGHIDDSKSVQLAHLAQTPFFLMLMLANYQKTQWVTNGEHSSTPTQWLMFHDIIRQLWKSPRVQLLLEKAPFLEARYADVQIIIERLSRAACKNIGSNYISPSEIERVLDSDLTPILERSRILSIEAHSDRFRFLHPLFADFFSAHQIDLNKIDEYAQNPLWITPLTILSTKGVHEHHKIQKTLISFVETEKANEKVYWALGEIGDAKALEKLFSYVDSLESFDDSSRLFTAMAKIANRLSDGDVQKTRVISLFRTLLLIPTTDHNHEVIDLGGWEAWSHRYALAETLANIRSEESLDLLLEALTLASKHAHGKIMSGAYLRTQLFAGYLARMGNLAIPTLLETIQTTEDQEVAISASEALRILNRPIPNDDIARVLETHFHPIVRKDAALRLARLKDPETIPTLIEALNDRGIWTVGELLRGFNYHYVSDSVAVALDYIGTPECKAALKNNYYDGHQVTIQLLLNRLDSVQDENPYQSPLRRHLAEIIADQPGGIAHLLPRMGYFKNVIYQGFHLNDPVAKALVTRFEKSQSDYGSVVGHPHNYTDMVPELLYFLETSSDDKNRIWASIALGYMADSQVLSSLNGSLNQSGSVILKLALAYSIAHIINRNHIDYHYEDLVKLSKQTLSLINQPIPEFLGTISLVLAELAAINAQLAAEIIPDLIKRLNEPNHDISKIALDTLESIFSKHGRATSDSQSSPFLIELNHIVSISPSFKAKAAYKEFQADYQVLNHGYDTLARQWTQIITQLEEVLEMKSLWRLDYSEKDWIDLGCSDTLIYFYIGRSFGMGGSWREACDAYEKSYQAYIASKSQLDTNNEIKRLMAFALRELGNISHSILKRENLSQIREYYLTGIRLCKETDQKPLLFDTQHLLLRVLGKSNSLQEIVPLSHEALDILDEIRTYPYDMFDEEREILFLLSRVYAMLGDTHKAMRCITTVKQKAERMGQNEFVAKALLDIASYKVQLGETESLKETLVQAQVILEKTKDWTKLAQVLTLLANQIYLSTDPSLAMSCYQQALKCLDKTLDWETPDQKAQVLHGMGTLLIQQEKYAEAETVLQEAVGILRSIPITSTVLSHIPHGQVVVFAAYAQCLHRVGKTQEAREVVKDALKIGETAGLEITDELVQVLIELDTVTGQKIPRRWLDFINKAVVDILEGDLELKTNITEQLNTVKDASLQNDWLHEVEFLDALLALLEGETPFITDSNTYINEFEQVRSTSQDARAYFEQIFSITVAVLTRKPEQRNGWSELVFLLGVRAKLSANHHLENQLRGVYEYLIGSDSSKPDLDPISSNVMQKLKIAVEGKE